VTPTRRGGDCKAYLVDHPRSVPRVRRWVLVASTGGDVTFGCNARVPSTWAWIFRKRISTWWSDGLLALPILVVSLIVIGWSASAYPEDTLVCVILFGPPIAGLVIWKYRNTEKGRVLIDTFRGLWEGFWILVGTLLVVLLFAFRSLFTEHSLSTLYSHQSRLIQQNQQPT